MAIAHPGATLLFADVPGTEEIPQFIAEAACQQALAGLRVFIGLQLPRTVQPHIDSFLVSSGTDADRSQLLQDEFWIRPFQDGRSRHAVFELLEYVRDLKARGRQVEVFAYEESGTPPIQSETAMARTVSSWRDRARDGLFLLLTADTHVRFQSNRDAHYPSLAVQLFQTERWLTSLVASHSGGTAWNCEGPEPDKIRCGLHPLNARHYPPAPRRHSRNPRDEVRFIARWPRPSPDGYQGTYYVGTLTPSLPAADKQKNFSRSDAAP
jgi:hypothetical protein